MVTTEAAGDVVERQVRAYNQRDLEEFVACYSPDVVVEDGDGLIDRVRFLR